MSSEILTKVEQLNKVLKRCSAIMADGGSATSNGSNEEEIKCLTNRYIGMINHSSDPLYMMPYLFSECQICRLGCQK